MPVEACALVPRRHPRKTVRRLEAELVHQPNVHAMDPLLPG
jgi:hypothetical protein